MTPWLWFLYLLATGAGLLALAFFALVGAAMFGVALQGPREKRKP